MAVKDNPKILQSCVHCPLNIFLSFNFSFVTFDSENADLRDFKKLMDRIKYLCSEPYDTLKARYISDKQIFFELISVDKMNWTKGKKDIPEKFRKYYPIETNEKFAVLRVYPSQGPKNARLIGMIKKTIFYVFFIDWNGELYNH